MFDLYKNIELLCKKHGTNPTRLCIDAGLSRSTLSNLNNGIAKTLSVRSATKIAETLGESYDTVVHGFDAEKENAQQELSEDDMIWIERINKLTPQQRKAVEGLIISIMDERGDEK